MQPTPTGWPRMSASLFYDDARAAIAFLADAFGFEARIVADGPEGTVMHSELVFGDAVVMIATARAGGMISPRQAGGHTGSLFFYVDDVDAHCARATAAGATITRPLETTDYGSGHWIDRGYGCTDPQGQHFHFAQRIGDSP